MHVNTERLLDTPWTDTPGSAFGEPQIEHGGNILDARIIPLWLVGAVGAAAFFAGLGTGVGTSSQPNLHDLSVQAASLCAQRPDQYVPQLAAMPPSRDRDILDALCNAHALGEWQGAGEARR